MDDLVVVASFAVAAAAVLTGLLTLLGTGRVRSALVVALDFLTAAGLLRLSAQQTWPAIGAAAGIVAVRHLLVWAFAQQPAGRSQVARGSQRNGPREPPE